MPRRRRHDGWTPERQVAFIEALAECGCVDEACARVGMSRVSAYALRREEGAASFRIAWDLALDHAIQRLADAAFGRAINGVARPIFYKGEQVGERRPYDERLAMFLLRYRDPLRYGAWLDACEARREPDGAARDLADAIRRLTAAPPPAADDATDDAPDGIDDDAPRPFAPRFPLRMERGTPGDQRTLYQHRRATREEVDAKLRKLLEGKARYVRARDPSLRDVP